MMTQTIPSGINRCAVLTPTGRGAVATVRVEGDWSRIDSTQPCLFESVSGRVISEFAVHDTIYGHWGQTAREDVVLCRLNDDNLDIHCHGGSAAIQRIVDDLVSRGFERCDSWATFEDSHSLIDREILRAVTECRTLHTATIAYSQIDGRMRRQFEDLLQTQHTVESRPHEWIQRIEASCDSILKWSRLGKHLTTPWRVVVAGRPNVGKSSLINAIVGFERSVVFDQPGTTRDVLSASTVLAGWPFEFFDTAGIRETEESIERTGIERAQQALDNCDAVVLVLDRSATISPDDCELMEQHPDAMIVANKCDLEPKWTSIDDRESLEISAATASGMEQLAEQLLNQLMPTQPDENDVIPLSERQVVQLTRIRDACLENDRELAVRLIRSFLA